MDAIFCNVPLFAKNMYYTVNIHVRKAFYSNNTCNICNSLQCEAFMSLLV